jgi:glycogen debranching enzyme
MALDFVLSERLDASRGLIWSETTIDWGDVSPDGSRAVKNRAVSIYSNAMAVIAIGDYLRLLGKDAPSSARWNARREQLKRAIRFHLWDAKREKFIPHLYLDGSPFPAGFDENAIYYHGGTAVANEADLLSRGQVVRALSRMREDVKSAGASSIGLTIYPPYPNRIYKSQEPYVYQNGGDWCWFGGRMVQQLVRLGMVADAYQEIAPMVARVVKAGDFHEWWTRDNRPMGSAAFKGSAGVLGKAVQMLQAWAATTLAAPTA